MATTFQLQLLHRESNASCLQAPQTTTRRWYWNDDTVLQAALKKINKLKLIPYSFLCVICWEANSGRKHYQFCSLPVRGACVCICEQEICLSASDIHKTFSPSFWREWLLPWLLTDLRVQDYHALISLSRALSSYNRYTTVALWMIKSSIATMLKSGFRESRPFNKGVHCLFLQKTCFLKQTFSFVKYKAII